MKIFKVKATDLKNLFFTTKILKKLLFLLLAKSMCGTVKCACAPWSWVYNKCSLKDIPVVWFPLHLCRSKAGQFSAQTSAAASSS